jgi:broad specificity phosphatase PhoE
VASHIVLVRHGATEWSESGRHTGRTDIPLTDEGRQQAAALFRVLDRQRFALVLTSPRSRARETARLAGFADAEVDDDLVEWDYGDYEGLTTEQIRATRPGWTVFDGVPNGETIEEVGDRADRVIKRVMAQVAAAGRAAGGPVDGPRDGVVALFSHGHMLRILGARWVGLPPLDARFFALDTATLSVLGYEHETRVLTRWNA